MKEFSYYSGDHLEYPIRPTKPHLKGSTPTKEDALAYAEAIGKWEVDYEEFVKLRDEHQRIKHNLLEQFKRDLADEYGYPWMNSKVTDLIYYKAWDDGHSEGLHLVESEYEELCEFADKLMAAKGNNK